MQCDDDNINQHKSREIRTLQTKQIKKNKMTEEKKQTYNCVVVVMMMTRKRWQCDDNHITHETKRLQMKRNIEKNVANKQKNTTNEKRK
jgi:hypothetical protein